MAAELLVGRDELRDTLVIIGSHDMTIDVIGDEIRRAGSPIRIASSNVGSLGGLIALKKGTCHLAGSHLLDVQSGQYNLSYIQRYLNEIKISIFRLVLREQGLIIAKGNPKGIKGLEDLSRKDITFVNRQAGSGTRVLLDFKIKKLGVEPKDIKGYRHEEFTHMAVAVDVLSGAADCGMGIFAAAKALELDFIPIEQEQYDLVIPEAYLNQTNIQVFLETICSHSFRERVKSLGGYDPSKSGQLWMETGGG
jgi:putative molybdopterin biosynthesis protein